MTCAVCETELPSDALFCGECGSSSALTSQASSEASPDADVSPSPPMNESAEIVDEFTRMQAPREQSNEQRFILQFSTGESVQVSGSGLIGRNPSAQPGEYFDSLVTIVDHERSVSKTHLEFGEESGQFWVADRFSANGTIVRDPDRNARRSEPGKRTRVSRGARVEIGEQFFIVS